MQVSCSYRKSLFFLLLCVGFASYDTKITGPNLDIGANAFAYMVLARMIYFYLPTHTIMSITASVLAVVFVTLDFISFVIQIIGGSYASPTAPTDQQLKGVHIYMGGIGLQQFFILIFLGLGVKFHKEMKALEKAREAKEGWKRLLWTLYMSLGFITASCPFPKLSKSGI